MSKAKSLGYAMPEDNEQMKGIISEIEKFKGTKDSKEFVEKLKGFDFSKVFGGDKATNEKANEAIKAVQEQLEGMQTKFYGSSTVPAKKEKAATAKKTTSTKAAAKPKETENK